MAQDIDVRFFYSRDDKRRPLITLCRVTDTEGRIAFAWAICSGADNPHKDDIELYDSQRHAWRTEPGGRTLAKGRALRTLAKGHMHYQRPIRHHNARDVMQACQAFGFRALADHGNVSGLPPSMQPRVKGGPHATE